MLHQSTENNLKFELSIKVNTLFKPKNVKYRDFKHFNLNNFNQELNSLPWMLWIMNYDEYYSWAQYQYQSENFTNMILNLFDHRVTKPKAPWLTVGMKFAMEERDQVLATFKLAGALDDHIRYKQGRITAGGAGG